MAEMSDGGSRLRSFMDGLPIETEWLPGHRIVWQTGQQDGPDGVGPEDHTHCSAFAAALALYLDIYILRPPNHSQQWLANAQVAWLAGDSTAPGPSAADVGWQTIGRASDQAALAAAVAAANAGKLVVAGYIQPDVDGQQRSGHVVAVRPQSDGFSPERGPQVTMAGDRNWREITMRAAFESHTGAWPDGIQIFVCDTDLEQEFAAEDGIG